MNGKKGVRRYAASNKNLIYCKKNNGLYVDLNGKEEGFGKGGMIARIDDCPEKNNINIVSVATAALGISYIINNNTIN